MDTTIYRATPRVAADPVVGRMGPNRSKSSRPEGIEAWQLIVVTCGKLVFEFGKEKIEVEKGWVTLTRPRTPLFYEAAEKDGYWGCVHVLFQMRHDWEELLEWPEASKGFSALNIQDQALQKVVRRSAVRLFVESRHPGNFRILRILNALERLLLDARRAIPDVGSKRHPAIKVAVDFIQANLTRNVLLEEMARAADVSPRWLGHLFLEEFGMSPNAYHERERILLACRLMELRAMSIGATAEHLGFSSQFYFSQRFKKVLGKTPREFRKWLK